MNAFMCICMNENEKIKIQIKRNNNVNCLLIYLLAWDFMYLFCVTDFIFSIAWFMNSKQYTYLVVIGKLMPDVQSQIFEPHFMWWFLKVLFHVVVATKVFNNFFVFNTKLIIICWNAKTIISKNSILYM